MSGVSVKRALRAAGKYDELETASHYAEPGYESPEAGVIVFGNWNAETRYNRETRRFETVNDIMPRLSDVLERLGCAVEWEDEWSTCDECNGAVRTSANSYCWQRSFAIVGECDLLCAECIKRDPTDYLEGLEGNTSSCVTFDLDLKEYGYVLLGAGFEHGFHSGQNANPKVIGRSLRALGVNRFLFTLDSVGQFDAEFSVWVHEDEIEALDTAAWAQADKDGPDISAGLQRALRAASEQSAKLAGEGIKYSRVSAAAGTAETRLVSAEEFVQGIRE